jgi:hypothetical protein
VDDLGWKVLAYFCRELAFVDYLTAYMLVGMDVIGPESIDISISTKKARIGSCNVDILLGTIAARRVNMNVRAVTRIQIPPLSTVFVSVIYP